MRQSLTGEFCQELVDHPIELAQTWSERNFRVFTNIFKIDKHQPSTAPSLKQMIDRLLLEYLTFEFITDDAEQHTMFLNQQWEALRA